jgi:hypothetical protein
MGYNEILIQSAAMKHNKDVAMLLFKNVEDRADERATPRKMYRKIIWHYF